MFPCLILKKIISIILKVKQVYSKLIKSFQVTKIIKETSTEKPIICVLSRIVMLKGEPLNFSSTNIKICPPSSAGIGSKLKIPSCRLMNDIRKKRSAMPDRTASPITIPIFIVLQDRPLSLLPETFVPEN